MTKEHVVGHNKSNILKFQRKHYEFPSFFSMFNFRLEFRTGLFLRQQWIVFFSVKNNANRSKYIAHGIHFF